MTTTFDSIPADIASAEPPDDATAIGEWRVNGGQGEPLHRNEAGHRRGA